MFFTKNPSQTLSGKKVRGLSVCQFIHSLIYRVRILRIVFFRCWKQQAHPSTICYTVQKSTKNFALPGQGRHKTKHKMLPFKCNTSGNVKTGQSFVRKLKGDLRTFYGFLWQLVFGNFTAFVRSFPETNLRQLKGHLRKLYGFLRNLIFGNFTKLSVFFGNSTVFSGNTNLGQLKG